MLSEHAMASVLPKLYCSWFCPFAQRAWIALLQKGVKFEYVEVDPYNKTEEFLAINPRGMVPAIVHNGKSIYESSVCIEYTDEAWTTDRRLLPTDPFLRARVRIWSDHITKKVVPPFYQMLVKREESERSQAKEDILEGMKTLMKEMDPQGPFFSGAAPNMVDIMLIPHAFRFGVILKHYRGFDIPDSDEWKRYHVWLKAALELDSVKETLPDRDELIGNYQRYADDYATSQVAEAARKGTILP